MFKSDTTEINKGTNSTYVSVRYNWNKQRYKQHLCFSQL